MYTFSEGKGHPIKCRRRHRREAEVYLQPIRKLGARRGWAVGTTFLLFTPLKDAEYIEKFRKLDTQVDGRTRPRYYAVVACTLLKKIFECVCGGGGVDEKPICDNCHSCCTIQSGRYNPRALEPNTVL